MMIRSMHNLRRVRNVSMSGWWIDEGCDVTLEPLRVRARALGLECGD